MYQKKYKHSILSVCFNQKLYLKQMLDSLLTKENIPYEIIIADDCSTDGSQKVLQEYKSLYPNIIKLILREKNIGITNNINGIYNEPSGDIISFVAGDDYISPRLIEEIDLAIYNSKLDPKKDKFLTLPIVANLYPNGIKYFNNNYIWNNPTTNKLSLAIRHKIITQNMGISRALFMEWPKFNNNDFEEIGVYSDFPIYVKVAISCDYFLRVGAEYCVHRCNVGITSKQNRISNRKSYNNAAKIILENFELSNVDKNYLNYEITKNNFYENKKIKSGFIFGKKWLKTLFIEKINKKDVIYDLFFTISKIIKNLCPKRLLK